MSLKKRVERLEKEVSLEEGEERILACQIAEAGDTDLPDFPYKNEEECKSYQRQLKEQKEKDPDKKIRVITLHCKDCKEDCQYTGKTVGAGKNEAM